MIQRVAVARRRSADAPPTRRILLVGALLVVGCDGSVTPPADGEVPPLADGEVPATDGGTRPVDAGPPITEREGFMFFRDRVEPLLAAECGSCHLGQRFAFASLSRSGATFSEADSVANYSTFFDLLSLDDPPRSRLLAKPLPDSDAHSIPHRGPSIEGRSAPLYETVLEWANLEKRAGCADCGTTAERAYVAYVQHPVLHWMIESEPIRTDRGERRGTQIYLQQVSPATAEPIGDPIDFLAGNESGFCADGDCDFGRLAASHDGTRLAFECRVSVHGEPWISRAWNLCVAEIGADGRAVSPRFLLPEDERHDDATYARTTPFGLPNGDSISPYNKHYQRRVRADRTPMFSADDQRIIFSSERPDPRSGADMVQTYHGTFFLGHIISTRLDGTDPQTLYRNEGGTADLPFYLRNGNIAFHTWNLDRMDRHLYPQMTQTGMMELPILGGHVQGPNMWGPAFQTNNGTVIGLTGRRRGELSNYAPFSFDHTMGIDTIDPAGDAAPRGFRMIVDGMLEQIGDYPNGYCRGASSPEEARATPNCSLDKLVLDPSYLPDGRALVAYNPETTYIGIGEAFYLSFASGGTLEQVQANIQPFLPTRLGVGTMTTDGELAVLIENPSGSYLRNPVWVGRRQRPRIQAPAGDESADWAEIHIANLPIWLSFTVGTNGASKATAFRNIYERIVALRVLRKIAVDNACIADSRYIEMSNANTDGYHPTALGYIDSTGFAQLLAPSGAGGDAHGDIPLASDGSVRVRVPPGELLLFQGLDAEGNVVAQQSRIFTLPPGEVVNTSVRRSQYGAQCASCHGIIDSSQDIEALRDFPSLPAELDYDTEASTTAVDLTGGSEEVLTYLSVLRPLLDARCVSCHQGEDPAGELSLQAAYSSTGNYPAGAWVSATDSEYVGFMASRSRVPSYNFSVSYAWTFRADHSEYTSYFADEMASDQPLSELAPWDPGYQNLFRPASRGFYYLNTSENTTVFGRARATPSNASRSFLIEVLTGRDTDPTNAYTGSFDHTDLLGETEVRRVMALLDVGMPYMARCNERIVPSGPNADQPWGDPNTEVR